MHRLPPKVLAGIVAVIITAALGWYFTRTKEIPSFSEGVVVEEELIVPNTESIGGNEGRAVRKGAYESPINPTDDTKIISARAIFTTKGAYEAAILDAKSWSSDAQLVSIQSLGVITSEGKSGVWQVLFGSAEKKAGYEIIVYGDDIASQKGVTSENVGYELPGDWYDSPDTLASLHAMPQFEDATVSSLSFFYNEDGKRWGYALATSKGTVSMPVK